MTQLKTEFYKLKNLKAIWICMICMGAILLISAIAFSFMAGAIDTFGQFVTNGAGDTMAFVYIASFFSTSNIALFIAIIVCIFVGLDFSSGNIKNVVARGVSRTDVYFSKLLALTVVTIILTLFSFIVTCLFSLIVSTNSGSALMLIKEILSSLGFALLFAIAYEMLVYAIAIVIKKMSGSMVLSIVLISVLGSTMVSIASFTNKPAIAYWTLTGNLTTSIMFSNANTLAQIMCIVVPFAYIVIFGLIGWLSFRRTDLK